MPVTEQEAHICGNGAGTERVRYFPRQLLTADDMVAEQEYFRQRQRRFNRFVLGWGVVCGLEVKENPDNPKVVTVCPGYALGPWGDEIYVPENVTFDLSRCSAASVDPCVPRQPSTGSSTETVTKYVAIKYTECPSRPVRTTPYGCGCDDSGCDYSRLRDGFSLECLSELPGSHEQTEDWQTLCQAFQERKLLACPPCPADPWLVLATLTITPQSGDSARTLDIDCISDRRIVVNAGVAQRQLLYCCCNLG